MEYQASLWLLHFKLAFNVQATLYDMFFRGFQQVNPQFERDQFLSHVKTEDGRGRHE